MNLTSQKRARSRLTPELKYKINQNYSPRQSSLQKQRVGLNKLSFSNRRWILQFLLGAISSLYILTSIQPSTIRDIPIADSYGPFLLTIAVSIYGFFRITIKSRLVCSLLTLVIITWLSLRLQGFHDIL